MKSFIAILSSSFLLCSCADMYVTKTDVAAVGSASRTQIDPKDFGSVDGVRMTTCGVGAANPKAIYIRPFCIDQATFPGVTTATLSGAPRWELGVIARDEALRGAAGRVFLAAYLDRCRSVTGDATGVRKSR